MPYVHCDNCHHEWECAGSSKSDRECDWCGGGSYILESDTPLAKMMLNVEDIINNLQKMNNPLADKVIKKILKKKK